MGESDSEVMAMFLKEIGFSSITLVKCCARTVRLVGSKLETEIQRTYRFGKEVPNSIREHTTGIMARNRGSMYAVFNKRKTALKHFDE